MDKSSDNFSITELEEQKLNKLFTSKAEFILSASKETNFPVSNLPEIAFIGRSNVGKSSLINSLVGRKKLARTSNTPGRTQLLNFFNISDELTLVDMPGYGYAKASKNSIYDWQVLIDQYLAKRTALKLLFLLIDSRHGLKSSDFEMMDILKQYGVPFLTVLTKADKSNKNELDKIIKICSSEIKTKPAALPYVIVSSTKNKLGINNIRHLITQVTEIKL